MKELTFLFDTGQKKELKEYLLSVNGISDVDIDEPKELKICVKYDQNLITPKIIIPN